MTLDGARGDKERLRDLAVREPLARELGASALAGCQRVESRENDAARARAGRAKLGLGEISERSRAGTMGGVECFA